MYFFQLKVFCDKGAERKFRQEERRASRKVRFLNFKILIYVYLSFYVFIEIGIYLRLKACEISFNCSMQYYLNVYLCV